MLHALPNLKVLDLNTPIIFGDGYKLCGLLQSPATSSLLVPNILLSTCSESPSNLCSSLHERDQVSHPYKTRSNIIDLYILIFTFLERNTKIKDYELNCSRHCPN
jgi:hypothetical protein